MADPARPGEKRELSRLRAEAVVCTRCPLYRGATQVVFGEGPVGARLMLVGEQPGDQEDLAGRPFVGPAGRLLDDALADAGIDRDGAYVTNAVKHFKYELRGKRRIHSKPNTSEIKICRWWLDRELDVVAPRIAVALGASAAYALAGRAVSVMRERGVALTLRDGRRGLLTVHPSYLLRLRDPGERDAQYRRFVADLKRAARLSREED